MQGTMADRFRRWFDYEQDAHAKVLRSLESVPESGRNRAEYQKAVAWLAHLAMARRIWLQRLGVIPVTPIMLFPENATLAEVSADLKTVEERWSQYLAGLTDSEVARTIEYTSVDGMRFRNVVEEILTQLFGHSSYHRGQIATLVKAVGGTPATTDFIYWCREPVSLE